VTDSGYRSGRDGPNAILVGVDGSPTSMRAGAYAAGLARRQGSRLFVVFVTRAPLLSGLAPAQALPGVTESIAAQARLGVLADFRAVPGDPYVELTRIAEELRVDAVIVGASAHAGHRLVGSLAVRLVRAGRWPVTVVP
jgi:nucleotide-binding universal stress UspA family protein